MDKEVNNKRYDFEPQIVLETVPFNTKGAGIP